MKKLIAILIACLPCAAAVAAEVERSEHAIKTLEMYTRIIEVESSKNLGNVPEIANYLANELLAAGFPQEDVEVVPLGETASLIAKYRGDGSSGKAPILLLGHMDVVEALARDWERPPFELTSDDSYFYARGTVDNKFGVAQLTSTFIRLKKEGFVPNRDLIIAFSGDEESGMLTTRMLAYDREDLAEAEFALNSDAGGGDLDADGNPVVYLMQAAEKTYVTWEITVRNPGGHSSRPRPDNAIYDLADAIKKIEKYRFPVRWSEMTQTFFEETGEQLGGELGDAMVRFANNPRDEEAADRLAIESSYVGTTRTTCVVTMLQAGHAENALPQSATATVNCRVFPGVPVSAIESALRQVVENDAIEFRQLEEATESPISRLRPDVTAAVKKAVHARYPDIKVIAYMESGGTDGMHFRKAGIPTWAVSGLFMNPDEMYAHGLNERVPIQAFYDGLDHWSIILRELAGNQEQ
ncbi:MAG: M20/M25/M40 family metallo-hydrolase [Gammaproteobacteria bacterium]|nr:M20/M25/M40 family metallo-hydrolase [Gammaproteobacteria bacterium]MBT8075132.1 M20/M25/M40 family metallo-hydrolase [Gammaproteobacteria bacterium]NNK98577.1 M20/M25/M40 family metallo-hydrolase [Xanthomonadales bacterium]